jgi:aminoglycoside 6'-N-acetyltransferase I
MIWTEPVSAETLAAWAALRFSLWSDEGQLEEAADWLATANPNQCNLVARVDGGAVVGFAEATLRHDYVNGTSTSPVVFLEGIFVAPDHRRQGVAAALVEAVAGWGRAQGCTEFASDALIDNLDSHAFHRAIGFVERERVVCFSKPL